MSFHSAPQTFVGSGPGWVPGHCGTSSEAGPIFGPSVLLGPEPIGLGRTGTGIGSTLHCLSQAPLGSLVAWLQERSTAITPVIPWPSHGLRGSQTPGVQERAQSKSTLLLWSMGNWTTLTGERGVQLSCTDSNPALLLPSYVTEL